MLIFYSQSSSSYYVNQKRYGQVIFLVAHQGLGHSQPHKCEEFHFFLKARGVHSHTKCYPLAFTKSFVKCQILTYKGVNILNHNVRILRHQNDTSQMTFRGPNSPNSNNFIIYYALRHYIINYPFIKKRNKTKNKKTKNKTKTKTNKNLLNQY